LCGQQKGVRTVATNREAMENMAREAGGEHQSTYDNILWYLQFCQDSGASEEYMARAEYVLLDFMEARIHNATTHALL
jgi:hypothetical protein